MYKRAIGWTLLVIISNSLLINSVAYAYPNQPPSTRQNFMPARGSQLMSERKFAEKPNAIKKVSLSDIDDIQTNSLETPADGGFWSNVFATVMQMLFNPGGFPSGPSKSEGLGDGVAPSSPWANLFSVGIKLLTTFLGGGGLVGGGDGIDKIDNGVSAPQGIITTVLSTLMGARNPDQVNNIAKQAGEFFNIVVDLLEALQTSFSHRSRNARNFGKQDRMSDAAVAGVSMMKGYVRSIANADKKCVEKYMCDANKECFTEVGQGSIFCQLGAYATSYFMQKTHGNSFDVLYEAGRRGRSGDDCEKAFLDCNEV